MGGCYTRKETSNIFRLFKFLVCRKGEKKEEESCGQMLNRKEKVTNKIMTAAMRKVPSSQEMLVGQ